MIRRDDAAQMSASERTAEIGSLLARGYRRSRLSSGNPLAGGSPAERPCDQPVDAGRDETARREEVA